MANLIHFEKALKKGVSFRKIILNDELTKKIIDLLLQRKKNTAISSNEILEIVNKYQRHKFNLTNIRRRIKTISKYLPEFFNEKKVSLTKFYWLDLNIKNIDNPKIKRSDNENIHQLSILKNANDFFLLKSKDLISKQNLYELIIKSKVKNSKYWIDENSIIGNTPQQGINWIGAYPKIRAVIIKYKEGSYKKDGWVDKKTFNYSFKAQKGIISKTELANLVLLEQIEEQYPIFLLTETKDKKWELTGRFNVLEVRDKHVVLTSKDENNNIINVHKSIYKGNKLLTTVELKKHFLKLLNYNFENIDRSNPFKIKIFNKNYYVYLKNITTANYPQPDVARIQLPSKISFEKVINSPLPLIVLGFDSKNESFTYWDYNKIKLRLNNRGNVSLFTRFSFQNEVKDGKIIKRYLSNGDELILFKGNSIYDFFENYLNLNEDPELFEKVNIKNKSNDIHLILLSEETNQKKINEFKIKNDLINAVLYFNSKYSKINPETNIQSWTKTIKKIFES